MIEKIDVDKEVGYLGIVSVPTYRRMANKINECINHINELERLPFTDIEKTSPNQTEDEFNGTEIHKDR